MKTKTTMKSWVEDNFFPPSASYKDNKILEKLHGEKSVKELERIFNNISKILQVEFACVSLMYDSLYPEGPRISAARSGKPKFNVETLLELASNADDEIIVKLNALKLSQDKLKTGSSATIKNEIQELEKDLWGYIVQNDPEFLGSLQMKASEDFAFIVSKFEASLLRMMEDIQKHQVKLNSNFLDKELKIIEENLTTLIRQFERTEQAIAKKDLAKNKRRLRSIANNLFKLFSEDETLFQDLYEALGKSIITKGGERAALLESYSNKQLPSYLNEGDVHAEMLLLGSLIESEIQKAIISNNTEETEKFRESLKVRILNSSLGINKKGCLTCTWVGLELEQLLGFKSEEKIFHQSHTQDSRKAWGNYIGLILNHYKDQAPELIKFLSPIIVSLNTFKLKEIKGHEKMAITSTEDEDKVLIKSKVKNSSKKNSCNCEKELSIPEEKLDKIHNNDDPTSGMLSSNTEVKVKEMIKAEDKLFSTPVKSWQERTTQARSVDSFSTDVSTPSSRKSSSYFLDLLPKDELFESGENKALATERTISFTSKYSPDSDKTLSLSKKAYVYSGKIK